MWGKWGVGYKCGGISIFGIKMEGAMWGDRYSMWGDWLYVFLQK